MKLKISYPYIDTEKYNIKRYNPENFIIIYDFNGYIMQEKN